MMSRCSLVSTLPGHQVPLQLCCFPGRVTHTRHPRRKQPTAANTRRTAQPTQTQRAKPPAHLLNMAPARLASPSPRSSWVAFSWYLFFCGRGKRRGTGTGRGRGIVGKAVAAGSGSYHQQLLAISAPRHSSPRNPAPQPPPQGLPACPLLRRAALRRAAPAPAPLRLRWTRRCR